MADIAAILTDLILVVSKGSIESSKFAELIAFVIILAFGGGGGLIPKDEQRVETTRRKADSQFR